MKRFSVLADVQGTGLIRHLTRAHDQEGACDRLRAAYPGRKVQFQHIAQRH